ncbi:hypothetical protein ACVWXP_007437 [Bradyrhizobium sp. USDA 4463]
MLGQLSTERGLAARVEGASSLTSSNVFRLDTTGVMIVCLVYLDISSPAHMRYSVRRLRRKLPRATIILSCLAREIDETALEALREGAKADLASASIGHTVSLSIDATGITRLGQTGKKQATVIAAA